MEFKFYAQFSIEYYCQVQWIGRYFLDVIDVLVKINPYDNKPRIIISKRGVHSVEFHQVFVIDSR